MRDVPAVLRHYARARRSPPYRDRDELAAWQDRRVRRLVAFVRARAPFYRDLWAARADADWRDFPATDRALVLAHFLGANTRGVGLEEALAAAEAAEAGRRGPRIQGLTAGLSSGTSGHRGVFLASAAERREWAGLALARLLPRPPWQAHRVALFLRAGSALYGTVVGLRLRFAYFDLATPLPEAVERLSAFAPTLLVGPPAVLRRLAESDALAIAPERVVAGADVVDALERAPVEARFGRPLQEVYQATEGFLGATCAHGTLHLNEDVLVVEREPVAGLPGCFMPVITDFRRRTQPVVRYRLDDVLRERAAPCPCGSVHLALQRVEGRASSVLHAPGPGGVVAVAPSTVHRALVEAAPSLSDYRLRQDAGGAVEVACVFRDGTDASALVAEALARCFAAAGASPLPVAVTAVPSLPLAPSGKLSRHVSTYRP